MDILQKEIEILSLKVSLAAKEAGLEPQNVIVFSELNEDKTLCQQTGKSVSDDENLSHCMYDVFEYAGFKLQGMPKALIAIY